jgi:dipeptidyl aminopeptidase/acylaminoacyl peptidase
MLTPGSTYGGYQIIALIGSGGMGEVYRARDRKLDRDVAIKILPEALATDPQGIARFEREAKTLAAVNQPHIAQIYGLEESNGVRALVMELIDGPTLADRIAHGPIPIDEALLIAKQIAEALEAAHEQGIIHRDLKPANIKVRADGKVKVLDFGLAKAFDTSPSSGAGATMSPTLSIHATQAGIILGTAGYMAPEQARGKSVDKRADIWAFGVVLYEMLTGQRPFEGETVSDTLIDVATKEPDWGRIPAAPGRHVDRLVRRCLEKDLKRRLQDIGDAWLLLEEVGAASGLTETRAQGVRRWLWAGVTALLAMIAAPVFFMYFREKATMTEVVRFQIPAPENIPFPATPVLSPNGRMIAFSARGPAGRNILWIRQLDTLDSRALPGTEDDGERSFWSPDSRFVGFATAQGKLKKVAAFGGPVQTLCDISGFWAGGAWSRNGTIIFGSVGHGLMRVPDSGGTPSPLTVLDSSREDSYSEPTFLPDGRHFFYRRDSASADHSGLYVGSLDSGPGEASSKRLLAAPTKAVYVPSKDPALGYLLYVREGSLMTQPFDTRRLEFAGEAVPESEGFIDRGMFSASENGVLAYRTGSVFPMTQLTWFDRTGKIVGAVGEPGRYDTVALSPDGAKVAVSRLDSQAVGTSAIWLYEFAHGNGQRFTFGPAASYMPVWSPDGSRLVFTSSPTGGNDLYEKASSGIGNEDSLLKSMETKSSYDWSRDGRWLLYGLLGAGPWELWILPLTGNDHKPRRYLASQYNESQARFSPDGRFVAYMSDESGRNEVYVQAFPQASGGKWLISKGGSMPHWRHDGKELFYISADSKMMAVNVTTAPEFRYGNPKALFEARIFGGPRTLNVTRYDVAPDGQKFLINALAADASSALTSPITVVLNWQMGLRR